MDTRWSQRVDGVGRTGKQLFPKTGLYSMEIDAWLDGAAEDVLFVPIAVDYEELLETKSLLRELSGGEKKKESFRALLGLPRFLVRKRSGRIYIQFEEPISLRTLAQARFGEAAGQLIYQVPDDKRPQLDINRNNVIHRYVAVSLIAAAFRASGDNAAVTTVEERTRWLSRLFKLEFMYRVDAPFETIFADNLSLLEQLGIVVRAGETLRIGARRDQLDFVADLTRAYLEAYRLVAETISVLSAKQEPLERRVLVKEAMERGRAAFLSGHIELRESLSKVTLETAVEWFSQQGAFLRSNGRWIPATAWKENLLATLIDKMDRHLSRGI